MGYGNLTGTRNLSHGGEQQLPEERDISRDTRGSVSWRGEELSVHRCGRRCCGAVACVASCISAWAALPRVLWAACCPFCGRWRAVSLRKSAFIRLQPTPRTPEGIRSFWLDLLRFIVVDSNFNFRKQSYFHVLNDTTYICYPDLSSELKIIYLSILHLRRILF